MKLQKLWYGLLFTVMMLVVSPSLAGVHAADKPIIKLEAPSALSKSNLNTVPNIIKNGFTIVITIAGVVFVVLFLIGGIIYMTSFGSEEGSKKAKQLLFDAVIGLLIVVTAWAVGLYILKLLGLSDGTTLIIER